MLLDCVSANESSGTYSQQARQILTLKKMSGPKHTCPVCGRLVEGIDNVEGVGVFLLHCVEFLAEEDVFLGHICEDELELGLVLGVGKGMGEDLVERGAERHVSIEKRYRANGSSHSASTTDQCNFIELIRYTGRRYDSI